MGLMKGFIGTAALLGALYTGAELVSNIHDYKTNPDRRQNVTQVDRPTRASTGIESKVESWTPEIKTDGDKIYMPLKISGGTYEILFDTEETARKFREFALNRQEDYKAPFADGHIRELARKIDQKNRANYGTITEDEMQTAEEIHKLNPDVYMQFKTKSPWATDLAGLMASEDKILSIQDQYFENARKSIRNAQEEYAQRAKQFKPEYSDVPTIWRQ